MAEPTRGTETVKTLYGEIPLAEYKDVIHTPSGTITREEEAMLQAQYPEGIPASAVEELVKTRPEPRPTAERRIETVEKREAVESITDLSKLTKEQYEAYQELSPEEKFDVAVKAGAVPEGSQLLKLVTYEDMITQGWTPEQLAEKYPDLKPGGTGWGYYTPEQVAQIEEAGAQVTAAKEAQQAAKAEFESRVETMPSELQKAYKTGGVEGYNAYLRKNYLELPNNQWIDKEAVNAIRQQSPHGYNILMMQGYDAYEKAVAQAIVELKPYKRGEGYRLHPAVASGITSQTLSLLFKPEDVEKAMWVWRSEKEKEEETTATSGLPIGFTAVLPAAAGAAVIEPTIVGEIAVGAAVAGAAIYTIVQGQKINWSALWDEIKSTFTREAQREPTQAELDEMEVMAAASIQALNIPVLDAPTVESLVAETGIKTGEQLIPPTIPQYIEQLIPPAIQTPIEQLIPPTVSQSMEQLIPPTVSVSPEQLIPPKVGMPNIWVAQSGVAVAEKELDDIITLIRPKIIVPSEYGQYLPAIVPKTETALIALDTAVGEAYASGAIDEKTIRVYHQARDDYLAKLALLDDAMRTYIGGMQPPISKMVGEQISLLSIAYRIAQNYLSNMVAQGIPIPQAVNQTRLAIQSMLRQSLLNQEYTQARADTLAQVLTYIATQSAVNTLSATQAMTQTQARTATQTLTSEATTTAEATAPAVLTAVQALTAEATLTPIRPILPLPLPYKVPRTVEELKGKATLPPGTIAFRMGAFWKYLPPPWHHSKMLTLSRGTVPLGAVTTGRTPEETIQVIGEPPVEVPESISADVGITDVHIFNRGGAIEFARGLRTNVGKRIESTTRGISIPSEMESETDVFSAPAKIKTVRSTRRVRAAKVKVKKQSRHWLDDLTSLKGIRW